MTEIRRCTYLSLPVVRPRADWGYSAWEERQGPGTPGSALVTRSFRSVSVDPDGAVRALDEVSGTYSLCHDLTSDELAEARRLAGVVVAPAGVR